MQPREVLSWVLCQPLLGDDKANTRKPPFTLFVSSEPYHLQRFLAWVYEMCFGGFMNLLKSYSVLCVHEFF